MAERPLVSVGVPVYNGEATIRRALDSLLAQDMGDFEVIICDNASTDATPDIAEAYAARDDRVRLHRNPENLGLAGNFNRTVELARGPLFKWATHDDWHAPESLRTHRRGDAAPPRGVGLRHRRVVGRPARGRVRPVGAVGRPAHGRTGRARAPGGPHDGRDPPHVRTAAHRHAAADPPHAQLRRVRPDLDRRAGAARPDRADPRGAALLHGADRPGGLPAVAHLRPAPTPSACRCARGASSPPTSPWWPGRTSDPPTRRRWPARSCAGSRSATPAAWPPRPTTRPGS